MELKLKKNAHWCSHKTCVDNIWNVCRTSLDCFYVLFWNYKRKMHLFYFKFYLDITYTCYIKTTTVYRCSIIRLSQKRKEKKKECLVLIQTALSTFLKIWKITKK